MIPVASIILGYLSLVVAGVVQLVYSRLGLFVLFFTSDCVQINIEACSSAIRLDVAGLYV